MRSFNALALSVALLLVGGATQAATLTADCSNPKTNLQTVINSAAPGDTILVNGTCTGQFTISQPLTLEGVASTGAATLNGNQVGSVLTVNATSGTVSLNDLIITNGTGTRLFEANTAGGGIYHTGAGTLTLNEVMVTLNQAGAGSGIENQAGSGPLILTHSSVNHNQCCASGLTGAGGGISMDGGSLSLTSSSVSHNQTVVAGGGISNNGTQVTLSNASLRGNVVTAGSGGGISNQFGTLTIHSSKLTLNSASANGGGIDNLGSGSLTNSTVTMNTAGSNGGGICNEKVAGTPLTLVDTTVTDNSPNDFCQ